MKAYTNDLSDSQLLIEKFVKIHKAHRNILDQETRFIDQWIHKIEKLKDEIDKEKESITNRRNLEVETNSWNNINNI